jgi:hypothetical protein
METEIKEEMDVLIVANLVIMPEIVKKLKRAMTEDQEGEETDKMAIIVQIFPYLENRNRRRRGDSTSSR